MGITVFSCKFKDSGSIFESSHLDDSFVIVEQLVLPAVVPGDHVVLLLLLLFGGNGRGDGGSRGRGGYGRVVGVVTVHHWNRLLLLLLRWVLVMEWLLRRHHWEL